MKQVKLPKVDPMPKPLRRYWKRAFVTAENSDNWRVFAATSVLWLVICIIAATL
jgi:hypothetical protein